MVLTEERKRKFFEGKETSTKKIPKISSIPIPTPTNTLKIELSEKQKKVLDSVISGKSVFFTGAAGTGKSLLLNYIINRLKSIYSSTDIGITASTGIAAINIGGCTLHSFLGLGLARENMDILKNKISKNNGAKNRWRNAKILIIDEISMIDPDFFDKVEEIARFIRKNNKPFGGIQVIATGDFYQLPPVNGDKLCFESKSWDLIFDEKIELTEIYRQSDFKFKKILNEIRYGNISPETEVEIKALEREIDCPQGIVPTYLYPLRSEVKKENEKRLIQLKGESKFYHSCDIGDPRLLEQIKKNCPAPEVLELKLEAQVSLIKNLDNTLINGSLGIVKGFSDKGYPIVYFPVSRRLEIISPQEWVNEIPKVKEDSKSIMAKRIQIPLILAWALSIHKSQGQTLDFVRVDLSKIFECGQAYVALSRATSMEGLQVVGFNKYKIKTNQKALQLSDQLD
jgi:ATP-dependent DNA helicase PIF1